MASQIDYSYIGEVNSRAIFANITIGLVAAGTFACDRLFATFSIVFLLGIQLFMSIYGLSVFLETPKAMRKGRTRYIVVSFLLSGLSILVASLDAAWIFGLLFASTSGYDFSYKFAPSTLTWERYLSNAATTAIILIGDVLLVSLSLFPSPMTSHECLDRCIDVLLFTGRHGGSPSPLPSRQLPHSVRMSIFSFTIHHTHAFPM
jgi:hypothetical protein